MKMNVEEEKVEKLEDALTNLSPDAYPDYTSDWTIEELRDKIERSEKSGISHIKTADQHRAAFARKSK